MRQRMTPRRSGRLGVLGVVVAVVAAACTAGSVATTTTTTSAATRVDCGSFIDTIATDPATVSYPRRVLDVAAFPGRVLDPGRDGEPGTPYQGLRFAKFGLVVRAGRALTLEIVKAEPGTGVMEWGARGPGWPATRLEVGPCPGNGSDWIVFAGGLWVSEDPTCVTLAASSGGRTEEVRLGVDAPCP